MAVYRLLASPVASSMREPAGFSRVVREMRFTWTEWLMNFISCCQNFSCSLYPGSHLVWFPLVWFKHFYIFVGLMKSPSLSEPWASLWHYEKKHTHILLFLYYYLSRVRQLIMNAVMHGCPDSHINTWKLTSATTSLSVGHWAASLGGGLPFLKRGKSYVFISITQLYPDNPGIKPTIIWPQLVYMFL